ncbi:uncharacterized protein RAG0_02259 [Rhynchosporium agropyri]|uniref:Uncharacterized protein n=1 Tax=Rhynchosporium agropyri TaxID=914238 RepID=A0A1E1K0S9_9HELO|nr:uncharacterized protein RAG0_02259 [Rhynchosporium agropyri]
MLTWSILVRLDPNIKSFSVLPSPFATLNYFFAPALASKSSHPPNAKTYPPALFASSTLLTAD